MPFSDLSSCETVIIPSTVRVINSLAFAKTSLKTILIPDSVETVDSNAFFLSDQLRNLFFEGDQQSLKFYEIGCREAYGIA